MFFTKIQENKNVSISHIYLTYLSDIKYVNARIIKIKEWLKKNWIGKECNQKARKTGTGLSSHHSR